MRGHQSSLAAAVFQCKIQWILAKRVGWLPSSHSTFPGAVGATAGDTDALAVQEEETGVDDEAGRSTSAGTLHALLLRCLQRAPTTSQAHSRDLVPLFLTFVASLSVPGVPVGPGHASGPVAPHEIGAGISAGGHGASDSEQADAPAYDAPEGTHQR